MYFFIDMLASGTCPNGTVYPVVSSVTVHVLSSSTIPNCTQYPVVTNPLPQIFELFSTFLFFSRLRERNIVCRVSFLCVCACVCVRVCVCVSFFLFNLLIYFLFYEKLLFKARTPELNLSEPMKKFLLLSRVIIFRLLQKTFVSLMIELYIFLVSKIKGQETADNQ